MLSLSGISVSCFHVKLFGQVFCQHVDRQHEYEKYERDAEGLVILGLLHAQIKLDGQRAAGLEDLVEEAGRGLGKKITASRGEQKGRGFSHDTSHGQDDAGDDAGHGGGKQDGADHVPFGRAHAERAASVAFRHGLQRFLSISGDQRKHHQGQRERAGQNGVAQAQGGSEEHHSEQTENDGGNAGKDLGGELNGAHYFSRLRVLVQIDGGAHADGRRKQQGDKDDIKGIQQVSRDTEGSLQGAGHRGEEFQADAGKAPDEGIAHDPDEKQDGNGRRQIDQHLQDHVGDSDSFY